MDCKSAKKLISLKADNELGADRPEELNAHLNSCPECREEMEFTSAILRELKDLEVSRILETPPYFFSRIKAKISAGAEGAAGVPGIFRLGFRTAFAGAAFSFLIIGFSLLAGALLGNTYWNQANDESASARETESTLNLQTLEALPENSFGSIYSEYLGGA